MQLKNIIIAAALLVSTAATAHELPSLAVTDMSVSLTDNGMIAVKMQVDPAQFALGGEREVTITPVIYNSDSTMTAQLPSVVVAGRTRWLRHMRGAAYPTGTTVLRSGQGEPYSYMAAVDYQPWMEVSTVGFDAVEHGCCGAPERLTYTPAAHLDLRPREFVAPDFIAIAPPQEDGKIVELHGSAFVDFRVNRTEIDPSYRKNPAELAKIIATINVVRDNPDATITHITIKGYASPEGSYTNNVRLAKGRTAALRDYVSSRYDFDRSIFHTDYEPEDWEGFRDSMLVSILPNRLGILELIDSDLEPDVKDATIKRRYPADWKYIHENIYPALRHSDYTVRYTIREYTDIEEIKRVMRERPGNLSLREFHLLASSYEPGSDEYNEVFDVAVRMFPEDSTSNINAAAVAINKGDWPAAMQYLSRVPASPAFPYLQGVMLARQGDYAAAREHLLEARRQGVPEAAIALDRLDALAASARTVDYIDDSRPHTFTR